MRLPTLAKKKQTLKRQLFIYMCVLAALLCALLLIGMMLIGSFTGTKARLSDTLNFQLKVFERQIDTYYDNLAVMSVQLSEATTDILEGYMAESGASFDELNGSQAHITELQEQLIEPLRHKLWEADCTGTFIMLDVQVNPSVENADVSRSGIYLQRNSLEPTDTNVLLYRGLSQIGKDHDCMPHRKWRLEFNTELIPNYDELKDGAVQPLCQSYMVTNVVNLPGTDQHVMLMTVPLLSDDGDFYGICGFEISEGYFKQKFSQPSELDRAIFCISKGSGGMTDSEQMLSAGVLNNYYLEPSGTFTQSAFGESMTKYRSDGDEYVGITRDIKLCPSSCLSSIGVLIPKQDYNGMLARDTVRVVLLISAFALSAVVLSLFFTKRYLEPIKDGLDSIRRKEYEQNDVKTAEISDLFAYLAEQDRANEEELSQLLREKNEALDAVSEMKSRYDEVERKTKRLAYSRKDEIDPYDYEYFKKGLGLLTEKENEVLRLYIEGNTVKDIISILGLQESTVRYHNKNIYSKLGVHSLKQLLRYAAVLEHEGDGNE